MDSKKKFFIFNLTTISKAIFLDLLNFLVISNQSRRTFFEDVTFGQNNLASKDFVLRVAFNFVVFDLEIQKLSILFGISLLCAIYRY